MVECRDSCVYKPLSNYALPDVVKSERQLHNFHDAALSCYFIPAFAAAFGRKFSRSQMSVVCSGEFAEKATWCPSG
jgi:hypothetical protein